MEMSDKSGREAPSKDGSSQKLLVLSCGVIGVGMLLPLNFYYNADAYWKHKWRQIGNTTQPFNLGRYLHIIKNHRES